MYLQIRGCDLATAIFETRRGKKGSAPQRLPYLPEQAPSLKVSDDIQPAKVEDYKNKEGGTIMYYTKPQLLKLTHAVESIQSFHIKPCSHADAVMGQQLATATAYESDE